VYIQSFFEGLYQQYFIIQKESAPIQSQVSLPEEDEDDKAQLLREFKEAREKDAEKQAVVEKEIEKSDNTG